MPPFEQLAPDAVALVLNIRGGRRQVNPMPIGARLERMSAAGADLLERPQQLASVVGQIVNPLEEPLLEQRSEGFIEFADAPGFRIQLKKLEAKE